MNFHNVPKKVKYSLTLIDYPSVHEWKQSLHFTKLREEWWTFYL